MVELHSHLHGKTVIVSVGPQLSPRQRWPAWLSITMTSSLVAIHQCANPINRADVRRRFDFMGGMPTTVNQTVPLLSVMMRQTEPWDRRPQGANPFGNMQRHRTTTPR